MAVLLFLTYDTDGDLTKYTVDFPWLPALGVRYTLGISGITTPLVLLNAIIFMAGVLVSWNVTHRPKDFFIWLMLLVAGVYGVFLSTDLFFLFFFYELAVVPMYLLIGVWGSSTDFRAQDPVEGRGFGGGGKYNRPKEYGAMKLMLYLVAGSVLVWVAIIAVWAEAYTETGMPSFSIAALAQVEYSEKLPAPLLPVLHGRFRRVGGSVALPHLVARRPRRRPDGRQHAARRCADEARRIRHPRRRHGHPPRRRTRLGARAHRPRHGQRALRRNLSPRPARPQVRHRLLQRQPHGLRAHGIGDAGGDRPQRRSPSRCSPTAS